MEVMSWLQRERFFLFENELFINVFQYADMCFKHIYNLQIKNTAKVIIKIAVSLSPFLHLCSPEANLGESFYSFF